MRRRKLSEKIDFRATRELRTELEAAADEEGRALGNLIHTILVDWAARRVIARGRLEDKTR